MSVYHQFTMMRWERSGKLIEIKEKVERKIQEQERAKKQSRRDKWINRSIKANPQITVKATAEGNIGKIGEVEKLQEDEAEK